MSHAAERTGLVAEKRLGTVEQVKAEESVI